MPFYLVKSIGTYPWPEDKMVCETKGWITTMKFSVWSLTKISSSVGWCVQCNNGAGGGGERKQSPLTYR